MKRRTTSSIFVLGALLLSVAGFRVASTTSAIKTDAHWIGTWAASPQRALPDRIQTFNNQTLRLIAHVSIGGKRVRIRIANTFGEQPLHIGAARVARRASGADIDATSDRSITFDGRSSITIPAQSIAISDAVNLDVPSLCDLSISLFLPDATQATTSHSLGLQTNYVSAETGDLTAVVKFSVAKTISSWPFLTGIDVVTTSRAAAIVAFGSSLTDGDGSTKDTNGRWPDVLAQRLRNEGGSYAEFGVLNEGIIGNRLLSDIESPGQLGGLFESVLNLLGPALGDAGVRRFDRDVLSQSGVRYVILGLGVNDILFPGSFIPAAESVSAQRIIEGNRELIRRAHRKGIKAIGTTIPPFEDSLFRSPPMTFSTPEKEKTRQEVNAWIRSTHEFDGIIDFDAAVRDPNQPTRILAAFDSGDHLHVNNAGNVAQANAIPLNLFNERKSRSY